MPFDGFAKDRGERLGRGEEGLGGAFERSGVEGTLVGDGCDLSMGEKLGSVWKMETRYKTYESNRRHQNASQRNDARLVLGSGEGLNRCGALEGLGEDEEVPKA